MNEDGLAIRKDPLGGAYTNELTGVPSRMRPSVRPHFIASIVVVEVGALAGVTMTQLADYAALRAFTQSDPARLDKVAAPTILKVFDAPEGTAVPITMTQWDLAYLRSLYGSAEGRYVGAQRGEMKELMSKNLDKAQTKD
jgi:hypothetical protein